MATSGCKGGRCERAAVRRARALELRVQGSSLRAIATELCCNEATVRRDIRHALAALAESQIDNARALRELELERIDEDPGRDHHPNCYSSWVAGGGVRGGQVVGKSDEIGLRVERKCIRL